MKKTILVLLSLLLIISFIFFIKSYMTNLVDIDNQNSIINSILDLKDYASIDIVKEEKYDNYYAVLYKPNPKIDNSKENLELSIYKKTQSFLGDKFEYFGGASTSRNFNTFNFNGEDKETIIIVYGDNRSAKAHSYGMTNSEITYKKNIDLDLILDIYIIHDSNNCSSVNELYDVNGSVIEMF